MTTSKKTPPNAREQKPRTDGAGDPGGPIVKPKIKYSKVKIIASRERADVEDEWDKVMLLNLLLAPLLFLR